MTEIVSIDRSSRVVEMPYVPEIERGAVLYVKSSGEPVTTLGTIKSDIPQGPSEIVIQVRRPVSTTDGIEHVVCEFFPEELETYDEKIARRIHEIQTERQAAKLAAEEPKPVN